MYYTRLTYQHPGNYVRYNRGRHSNHENSTIASLDLQEHLHIIEKWLKKWKTKVNEKSSHITFTPPPPERPLPDSQHQSNYHTSNRSSKILRTTFRLQVKLERANGRKKETNRLKNKRYQLVNRKKSHLSIENKLLIYIVAIKPIWSY